MKRVRCPQCGNSIIFNENNYTDRQTLMFICPDCKKKFGIRQKSSSPENVNAHPSTEENQIDQGYGSLTVIKNVFHQKQTIFLNLGDNVIGKYIKGNPINCPIHSYDPSIDMTHCILFVDRDKDGNLKYTLRDGPSNTGTFVGNNILKKGEQRVIDDSTLFTIGATSIILNTPVDE